jgi:hypothetical protein
MDLIQSIYEPYNFSANPCYIIGIEIAQAGYNKIEQKVPDYLKHLTGIFATVTCRTSANIVAGVLMLNFNQQLNKCFQQPIIRTNSNLNAEHSTPFLYDEEIIPNMYMQGFFYDQTNTPGIYPYTLAIYLHYQKNVTP